MCLCKSLIVTLSLIELDYLHINKKTQFLSAKKFDTCIFFSYLFTQAFWMDLSYNCPANAEPYLCQQLLQRMIKTLQQVTYTLYKNKQIQPKTQKSLQIFS